MTALAQAQRFAHEELRASFTLERVDLRKDREEHRRVLEFAGEVPIGEEHQRPEADHQSKDIGTHDAIAAKHDGRQQGGRIEPESLASRFSRERHLRNQRAFVGIQSQSAHRCSVPLYEADRFAGASVKRNRGSRDEPAARYAGPRVCVRK